jgi:hypothetical protein
MGSRRDVRSLRTTTDLVSVPASPVLAGTKE